MILDIEKRTAELLPSYARGFDAWKNYVKILCSLYSSNDKDADIKRIISINLPPPTKPALEKFLNNLYNNGEEGIVVENNIKITNGELEKAGVKIYVPAEIIGNTFFPSDYEYIKVIIGTLLPYGIAPKEVDTNTGFTIYFDDNGENRVIVLNDLFATFIREKII